MSSQSKQADLQAGALRRHCMPIRMRVSAACAVLAIGGGLLAGTLVAKVDLFKQSLSPEMMYEDAPFWAEKGEEEE